MVYVHLACVLSQALWKNIWSQSLDPQDSTRHMAHVPGTITLLIENKKEKKKPSKSPFLWPREGIWILPDSPLISGHGSGLCGSSGPVLLSLHQTLIKWQWKHLEILQACPKLFSHGSSIPENKWAMLNLKISRVTENTLWHASSNALGFWNTSDDKVSMSRWTRELRVSSAPHLKGSIRFLLQIKETQRPAGLFASKKTSLAFWPSSTYPSPLIPWRDLISCINEITNVYLYTP